MTIERQVLNLLADFYAGHADSYRELKCRQAPDATALDVLATFLADHDALLVMARHDLGNLVGLRGQLSSARDRLTSAEQLLRQQAESLQLLLNHLAQRYPG